MKPLILITNDDGVFSPGLQAAAEAVADFADVLIAAPRYQQTAMSRALPHTPTSGIIESVTLQILGQPHPAYGIHASPSLAVIHGVLELAPRLPDLCISGINYGDNVGATMPASGTVGAAMEASLMGIPALATSREADVAIHRAEEYAVMDWHMPAYFTRQIARQILQNGMPPEVAVWNLNVPEGVTEDTEIRHTVQSRQKFFYYIPPAVPRDFSQPFHLKAVNQLVPETLELNSDIRAFVFDKVVSLTPLSNNLTARVELTKWDGTP